MLIPAAVTGMGDATCVGATINPAHDQNDVITTHVQLGVVAIAQDVKW